MSYEGTVCPCGDKKEPNTMLCNGCMSEFSQHPSMSVFLDKSREPETRRHAALTLLALARGRKVRRAA
jgi:hypothetical protein